MREILFRGKRLDNGEWVYGYLIAPGFASERKYIGYLFSDDDHDIDVVEVDHETVGQYTGLKDQEGRKIFEGDIAEFVAYGFYYQGVVTVIDSNSCILCGEKAAPFLDHALEHHRISIVGNIHDNPELLEVKQNDD